MDAVRDGLHDASQVLGELAAVQRAVPTSGLISTRVRRTKLSGSSELKRNIIMSPEMNSREHALGAAFGAELSVSFC